MGVVNGLAVYGPNMGVLIEVEATAIETDRHGGSLVITGVMEEEEMGGGGVTMRRKSMARSSVDNVLTVIKRNFGLRPQDYEIHVNFPGGIPIDGPSAGISMVTAIYSAMTGIPVNPSVAMTGEVSIRGTVRPVGGVVCKLEAAKEAGASLVLIPEENRQQSFGVDSSFRVIGVSRIEDVIRHALIKSSDNAEERAVSDNELPLVAETSFS